MKQSEMSDFFYYEFLSETDCKIVDLLRDLCPDFVPYNYLKCDLYKGALWGGTNVYFKRGTNGDFGMVTTKTNIRLYNLGRFPFNFQSEGNRNGKSEQGWSGEVLLDLVKHLHSLKK